MSILAIDDQVLSALLNTLLHSLWQASIIAFALHYVLRYIPEQKASLRYRASTLALFICLVVSLATFNYYLDTTVTLSQSTSIHSTPSQHVLLDRYITKNFLHYFLSCRFIILTIWLGGVCFLGLRLLYSYAFLQWLSLPSHVIINQRLYDILNSITDTKWIKGSIQIFESPYVHSPVLMGTFRPIILFPIGLINQLSADEVASIISHEIAHIIRYDYIINIIQSIIEIIFYYHPAVWWISANIRAEREFACDQMVMAHANHPINYAKLLIRLQEHAQQNTSQLAMAFASNNSNFSNRIKRILNMSNNKLFIKEKLMTLVFIGLSVFMFAFSNAAYNYNDDQVIENTATQEYINTIQDTLPKSSKSFIKKIITVDETSEKTIITKEMDGDIEENQDVEVEMENGEISSMIINGKKIDPKDYDKHMKALEINENITIDSNGEKTITKTYTFDNDIDKDSAKKSKSIRIEKHMLGDEQSQEELINKLKNIENIEDLETLKELIDIDALDELNLMDDLEGETIIIKMREGNSVGDLEEMSKDLNDNFGQSRIIIKKFEDGELITEDIEGDNIWIQKGDDTPSKKQKKIFLHQSHSNKSISEKIVDKLNQDGLLEINQNNKIELSGKHLKINGDKQAKNIYSKYKRYYEKLMGMELTKGSKIEFNAKGIERNTMSF